METLGYKIDCLLKGARGEGKAGQDKWGKEARKAALKRFKEQGLDRLPCGCLRGVVAREREEQSMAPGGCVSESYCFGISDLVPLWYMCQQHKPNVKHQNAMINSVV